MKDGLGNETQFSYPEVFSGATEWASKEPDGSTITVSADGLRKLLALVGDCWPAVVGSLVKTTSKDGSARPYDDALTFESLADLCNRLSAVWCEGDLIVSQLFLDDDGKPIVSPCAEEDRSLKAEAK